MARRLLRTFDAFDANGMLYRLREYVDEIDVTHSMSTGHEKRDGLHSITTDKGQAVNRLGISEFLIVSTSTKLTTR